MKPEFNPAAGIASSQRSRSFKSMISSSSPKTKLRDKLSDLEKDLGFGRSETIQAGPTSTWSSMATTCPACTTVKAVGDAKIKVTQEKKHAGNCSKSTKGRTESWDTQDSQANTLEPKTE